MYVSRDLCVRDLYDFHVCLIRVNRMFTCLCMIVNCMHVLMYDLHVYMICMNDPNILSVCMYGYVCMDG
jgi:hypothetical protein